MGSFGLYLIKSVFTLSLLYIFYWLTVRKETYHSWNRFLLLTFLLSAFVLPLLNISVHRESPVIFHRVIEPVIVKGYDTGKQLFYTSGSYSILSIIYISGAVFFMLRFLSNLARIHYLYFRFPKYNFNGFKAVILDANQSPFTFFHILFISREDYEQGKIDEMIVHEKAHKDAYHSFDIILLEIMTIVQWFNPFIWMFRLSLMAEHEFTADNKVLSEGFDKVNYQKLLFEKSLGITSFGLTNNFNYSLLKKRLKMMTTSKSGPLAGLKYLLTIPVLFITFSLLAFNFNIYGQKDKDEPFVVVDVMPTYNGGGINEVRNFVQENLIYPESAIKNHVSAKIFVQFAVNEHGKVVDVKVVHVKTLDEKGNEIVSKENNPDKNMNVDQKALKDLEKEAVRVIKSLKDFTPAQKDGKNVEVQYTMPVSFVLDSKKDK
jgi:hypothetical protein